MQPRFQTFASRLLDPSQYSKSFQPFFRSSQPLAFCRSCQRKFSTTPKRFATKKADEKKYSSRLLIYDAGDTRLTWVSFWKAVALLQCGTTLVFAVPPLWKNENQPDPNLRKAQAILVGVLGTIPTLTLAYLTAPFTHQVFLRIPEYARRSRQDLMNFARSLNTPAGIRDTANTKLEFVTLRIFPFRKHTSAFLHELRALPPKKMRLANIELPKSDAWAQRQREKGIFRRMLAIVNEPRFKFYVKEGRMYTMKTGVPGVWEEVAKRMHEQTAAAEAPKVGSMARIYAVPRPVMVPKPQERIKRQTARMIKR